MLYMLLFLRHPFDDQDYKTAILHGPLVIPASRYCRNVVQQVIDCLEPEQHRRPAAGWIHRAFHEAFRDGDDDLEAINESDLWIPDKVVARHMPAETYIEMLPLDLTGATAYSYYEATELDWQHFRVAKLDRFSGSLIRLTPEATAWRLSVLQDKPPIDIGGVTLGKGGAVRLGETQLVHIGTRRFQITVRTLNGR